MFLLATYIGSYAYAIFACGLLQKLTFAYVFVLSLLWLMIGMYMAFSRKAVIRQTLAHFFRDLQYVLKIEPRWWVIISLMLSGFGILFIGALGPELQHDALWYHLTLPKLYLQSESIEFFSGDTFYYSSMPQLIEMLFIPALVFGNELGAKLIHFGFGMLSLLVLVLICWPRWGIKASLIASLMVMTDLSFGWASSTANIDLGRSFFELTGVYMLVRWWEKPSPKLLFKAGLVMGLALSTKYLSFASVGATILLIGIYANKSNMAKSIAIFSSGVFLTSCAWFARAFYYTGNPLYPLFTKLIDNSSASNPQNLWQWMQTPFFLSLNASLWDQALSPLFVLLLPVSLLLMRKNKLFTFLSLYALFTFGFWLLIPRTGGTRFLLPYLPIWAIMIASFLSRPPATNLYQKVYLCVFTLVASISCFNLLVAAHIRTKNVGYILGNISKHDYLRQNLNLRGNLYDVDGKLGKTVIDSDLVYVIGSTHLYYAPFRIVHESYGSLEEATHILVQNAQTPEFLLREKPIYQNNTTEIQLFTNPRKN